MKNPRRPKKSRLPSADDYVVIFPEIVEDFGSRTPAEKEQKTTVKKPKKKRKPR